MPRKVKKLDLTHTSICRQCAEARGAKPIPGHCGTIWIGNCPYCKRKDVQMAGTNDMLWPDTGKPRGEWD